MAAITQRTRAAFANVVGLVAGGLLPFAQPAAFAQAPGETNGPAALAALEHAFVTAIEQAEGSVVSIARITKPPADLQRPQFNPFERNFEDPNLQPNKDDPRSPDFIPNEFGAGVVIAPFKDPSKLFVLTNYHVIRGTRATTEPAETGKVQIYVRLANRLGYDAKIVAADPRSDLAVLDIDVRALRDLGLKPDDLRPIKLGRADDLRKGQIVLALGNPYAIGRDGSASASWGMISNISRQRAAPADPLSDETMRAATIHHLGTLLHIDTRLDLGSSGGALVNLRGELIGITTSLAALDGYEKTVGYAIPLDEAARGIIEALAKGYEVEYGFLGISPMDVLPRDMRQLSETFKQPSAARASGVIPNSPAGVAGLMPGDVILEVDGQTVYDHNDLMRLIALRPPGTSTPLKVWREQARRELTLKVQLGKWPVWDDEGIIATSSRYPVWRGLTVDYPTARHKHLPYPQRYHQAVLITGVLPDSPAERAELKVGEFISHVGNGSSPTSVETPAEFHQAVDGRSGDVVLELVSGRRVSIRE